ncbi:phospholipase A2 inhibitor and Ly6/PLAUR domain-containing protein-like [Rhinoderma darwinii]|uniref:phospholipase A2 inhibitor and Ly6/PLAUR domain-containing protein-like n=1 Tax=Rhinoderma darwinii TaxID=43563 RepID=UPI003F679E3E
MASAVAVLCLVAGLLQGALSLTCYHCNAIGNDCSGNEKLCDKAFDKCISTITEIITQGKGVTKSVVRSCGNKEMCNRNYSISLNATNLHATTKCCDKDKCTITNLEVPKTTTENEVECSTCNEPLKECKNLIKIKCTGEEKKCATYTAKDAKTKFEYTSRVCVTENVCTMKNITTLPFDQIQLTEFDCSNLAPAMLPGLFFPVAIVIAMLKLLS